VSRIHACLATHAHTNTHTHTHKHTHRRIQTVTCVLQTCTHSGITSSSWMIRSISCNEYNNWCTICFYFFDIFADPSVLARFSSRFSVRCLTVNNAEWFMTVGPKGLTRLVWGVLVAWDPVANHTHRTLVVNPVTGDEMKKITGTEMNIILFVFWIIHKHIHTHTHTHTDAYKKWCGLCLSARTSRSGHASYSCNTHVLVVMSHVAKQIKTHLLLS
jgi:hypothetical protein